MSDEIPAPVAAMIISMKAEIILLRRTVQFLCRTAVSPEALEEYLESLDSPIAADTPEATEVVHKTLDAFVSDFSKFLSAMRNQRAE